MYKICKRITDLVIAIPVTIILLGVFGVVWLLIRISSPGSAIFKQTRAGLNGKPFTLYKFRTMRSDVDPFGPSPKSGQDPRLTKIGKFLRETSLDELPQIFNILKGEMSIVGPRPLYVEQMAEWNERQKRRLEVKPGLTGLAQIKGRGQITIEEKLDLDVKYVESASFWLDVKIVFATFAGLFKSGGIYEKNYSKRQRTRGQI